MLNVYKVLSESISSAILSSGEQVTKQPLIRAMKTVKKEILNLISLWVSKTNDVRLVADNFVEPLLDAVLMDYRSNVPTAREPEVCFGSGKFKRMNFDIKGVVVLRRS
jgi:exportin-1